jgi:hypothetical protein
MVTSLLQVPQYALGMPKSDSEEYSSVAGEETPWLGYTSLTYSNQRSQKWRMRMQIIIHIVGSVVLLLCGVVIGHNMRNSSHKHHPAPQDSDLALCKSYVPLALPVAPTDAAQFTEFASTRIQDASTALFFEEVNTVVLQVPRWMRLGLGSLKQEAVCQLLSTFQSPSSDSKNKYIMDARISRPFKCLNGRR